MRTIRWLPLCFAVACGGDDAGAPDDATGDDGAPTDADVDGSPTDAATDGPPAACPTWETCGSPDRAGVIYQDGCAPVACGYATYRTRDITAHGESPSGAGFMPDYIAYVATSGAREVRMNWFRGSIWVDEPVAPVLAAGPTGGTSVAPSAGVGGDPTIWIAWAESDGSIGVAHRLVPLIGPQPPWIVSRGVAGGRAPQLHATSTFPLLAYLAGSELHVRRFDGAAWSAPSVVATDVASFRLGFDDTGFETMEVVWRTAAQDVRVARSRNGMPFEVREVATGLPVNPNGAAALGGFDHVLYTRDPDTTIDATYHPVEGWKPREIAHFSGQGANLIRGGSSGAGLVYTSALGVHAGHSYFDPAGNSELRFIEQLVSRRCAGGRIAADVMGATGPLIIHACDDGLIYAVNQWDTDGNYDWHQRCLAAAGALATTARACATGARACIVDGAERWCGEGDAVTDLAYARLCGVPTAELSYLDACEPAVAAVGCVPDGGDGTATVPAACIP